MTPSQKYAAELIARRDIEIEKSELPEEIKSKLRGDSRIAGQSMDVPIGGRPQLPSDGYIWEATLDGKWSGYWTIAYVTWKKYDLSTFDSREYSMGRLKPIATGEAKIGK